MQTSIFLAFTTALALVAGPALSTCLAARQETRPNFVFINGDDLTHRDLGCYGGQAHTPNIDGLAARGMRFTHCFQAAPMCSPTRHNIYTGLYPVKSGAYPNHTFAKAGTRSIVQYLEPLGYRVALSGKTHIGPKEVFPFEYSGNNNPDMEAVDRLFSECKASETPFCLFACSNEPHTPWDKGDPSRYPPGKIVLPPYIADTPETREGYSKYLAEITYYDGQVGAILALLEKHGQVENTLVLVTSEQGNSMPFAKWTLYDSGLQTALIAHWPGKIEAGAVTGAMVEYVDVVPTLVEAAGGTPDPILDGKSFLPVLTGAAGAHKDHVYGIMTTRGIINHPGFYGIRSIRSRQYKLIVNLTPEVTFTNACTKSPEFLSWIEAADRGDADAADKVRRYQQRPAIELYDVSKDRFEWENLAENPEYAGVIAELRAKLDAWMAAQGDLGQETELAAFEHQHGNRKKKSQDPAEVKTGAGKAKGQTKAGAKKTGGKKTDRKKSAAPVFETLFDGTGFDGWTQSGNWVLEDGAMFRKEKGGSIVYTAKPIPDDFELLFDWKVGEGSNSGVYYRPSQYEYQILDNAVHRDGANPRTSAASLYFCMQPSHDATKPVGEWNSARIVCQGSVVQHWLNGDKVVDMDYQDPKYRFHVDLLKKRGGDLTARGANLSFQDHGNPVWFRNVRLRTLGPDDNLDRTPVTPAEIAPDVLAAEKEKLEGIIKRREEQAKKAKQKAK